jgi:SPP1 gp7 family putative phage head morphogenesis protein
VKPLAAALFARRVLGGIRSRRRRMPRQREPNVIRLAYAHAQLSILRRARELVDQALGPKLKDLVIVAGVVHDAVRSYPDEVNEALDVVSERFFREFTNERLRQTALDMARRASKFQKGELSRQLAAAFGQEIGIDIFAEPGIERRLEAFAAANVKLVKRVPQQFFDEVGTQVVQALRSGQRAEDLQQVIQDRFAIGESRARLIARDQIGKLNGELNSARQQDLGIDRFTWRTSEDERVRPEHEVLDGVVFEWSDPPSEGIPGEPINCRCTAEPDVQSVIDAL